MWLEQLSIEDFKALIRDSVHEALSDLLANNPDFSLEPIFRTDLVERLRRYQATPPESLSLEAARQELGLDE